MDARKRKVVHSKHPLEFQITEEHVKNAATLGETMLDSIGKAVRERHGEQFRVVQLGTRTTRLISDTQILCYRTTAKLRKILLTYDESPSWRIPPGIYRLNAYVERVFTLGFSITKPWKPKT